MSELKVFESERIYWSVEQVEREAGDIDSLHLDDNLFYIKSEADKVIADLEDKLKAANEQIENLINSASSIMLFQDRVNDNKCDELSHNKYKRCLAMAMWCHDKWNMSLGLDPAEGYTADFFLHYQKWEKRWLELAEQFKEAK